MKNRSIYRRWKISQAAPMLIILYSLIVLKELVATLKENPIKETVIFNKRLGSFFWQII
jgi:hypothetical protein